MSDKRQVQRKRGVFDFDTLTVKFGGELSKPENVFTAQAVKVPKFKYTTMEQADAGGGCYYGYKEEVEHTEDNAYIIIRDGSVIGWMIPYHWGIKSELFSLDEKHTRSQIRKFAKQYQNQTHD